METLEINRRQENIRPPEEKKVFDPLASIWMLRNDLDQYQEIQDGTWQQIYNEEFTYIAENLDAPLKVQIDYCFDCELGILDERGVSQRTMLQNGLEAAQDAAQKDHRDIFLAVRAKHNRNEGEDLEHIMRHYPIGTRLVSWSPFPQEIHDKYPGTFIEDRGFNADRKLGFLYVYEKKDSYTLTCTTASIDNSDIRAFREMAHTVGVDIPDHATSEDIPGYRAIVEKDGSDHDEFVDKMLSKNDQKMTELYPNHTFIAGRSSSIKEVDAWELINANGDIIEYYLSEIEGLASNKHLDEYQITKKKKLLTVSVWTMLREALDSFRAQNVTDDVYQVRKYIPNAYMDMHVRATATLHIAAQRYGKMIGCGGSISLATEMLSNATTEELSLVGFGESKTKKELSWHGGRITKGKCVNCKEGPKDVGVKNWCKGCIKGHCG